MAYIFDSNIFIRSKNEMPMEIWPTFWTRMRELIEAGHIRSSIEVKKEINRGDDELTSWIKKYAPDNFYIALDSDVMKQYEIVQQWALNNPIFTDIARQTFAEVADAYLIATAAAKDLILVTYETSDPKCKRRVKIPDACNALSVRFCDLNTALKELNINI